jgi:hypothetical protein
VLRVVIKFSITDMNPRIVLRSMEADMLTADLRRTEDCNTRVSQQAHRACNDRCCYYLWSQVTGVLLHPRHTRPSFLQACSQQLLAPKITSLPHPSNTRLPVNSALPPTSSHDFPLQRFSHHALTHITSDIHIYPRVQRRFHSSNPDRRLPR